MFWFNNNFSNLTRSILFPGGGGGSSDVPVTPHSAPVGSPAPDHSSLGGGRGVAPSRGGNDNYDRDAAAQSAAYNRMARPRDRWDYDYRDQPEQEARSPEKSGPPRKKDDTKDPPPKGAGDIFRKVPILPLGKKK